MSLILSYINRFGIVLASDSNLSNDQGNAGFGQKVFPIPHLNAGLAYSGTYYINGSTVDTWVTNFITGSFYLYNTIEEFTSELCNRLSTEMREHELNVCTILHIAGYSHFDSKSYVEHWHISNTSLLSDGSYDMPSNEFKFSCDFNSRLNQQHRAQIIQNQNDYFYRQYFINGLSAGRISANQLIQVLEQSLNEIWSRDDNRFRKPANIFETGNIIKLYFELVIQLFKMSDYNALYIGGEVQTHLIPVPQNLDLDSLA
ncbi:MAG: hypothetical protein K2P88_01595 [Chitinophagaceae bacterium]|nr:hypothetical protein [Chitinophagaceae bacterium]